MKQIIFAVSLAFAATAAQAQNLYLDSHNGTPPFIYGSQPPMEPAQIGQGAGPWGTAIPSGPTP